MHTPDQEKLYSIPVNFDEFFKGMNRHAIITLTDIRGTIIYVNKKFCEISGYKENELIGQNHRILKSGWHSNDFYRDMWLTISKGNVWQGVICNRAKDSNLYWVESTICRVFDENQKKQFYLSIRTDVTQLVQRKRINEIFAEVSSHIFRGFEKYYEKLARALQEAFNVSVGFIVVFKKKESKTSYHSFFYSDNIVVNATDLFTDAGCHWISQNKSIFIGNDLAKELPDSILEIKNGFKALATETLIGQNGEVLGFIGVLDEQTFTRREYISDILKVRSEVIASEVERWNAENALDKSNEKLGSIISNLPGMIYRIGMHGGFDYFVNIELICGHNEHEICNELKNWHALIHPDDRLSVEQVNHKLSQQEEHVAQDYRILHKNGEWRWIRDQKRSLFDSSGTLIGIDGIILDITENKQARALIESQNERFRRSQNYANFGTWDLNLQTNELYWTEQVPALFGYKKGELETTYENFLEAVHPDDRQFVINSVEECINENKPYNIEHRVVWPDGKVYWLSEKGAITRDHNGKPLQMLGVVQDINDKKIFEIRLKKNKRELEKAQRLAHIGSWSVNYGEQSVYWSEELFRILALDKDRFIPRPDSLLSFIHTSDKDDVVKQQKDAIRSGGVLSEYRIINAVGKLRHIREVVEYNCNQKGELISAVGTIQDITLYKLAEFEVLKAKDDAEQANSAKSEFLSRMSHELRTPMNAILGFSQLLEYDSTLSEDQMESVLEISKASRHLLDLINEVLDLSKIESGKLDVGLENIETTVLIQDCMRIAASEAKKKNIEIEFVKQEDNWVIADRLRLKQVILNLLSNAIKYNHHGGKVTINCGDYSEGWRMISVKDSGRGIASEDFQHIFNPFERLGAKNSEIEGAGIGLTICKRIVDSMAGKILVDSELGKGSCFTLLLKPAELKNNENTKQETIDEEEAVVSERKARNDVNLILYIEDNRANAKLVTRLIDRLQNVTLINSPSGIEGIKIAKSLKPSLILLDICLPDIDGYEVFSRLSAEPGTRDIPIIAISANAMKHDIEKAKDLGFKDYLSKPIEIEHFYEVIRQTMG
ncbi:PAS domain-containing protein [Aliikangiella sp. G2MR2-5]|uniref:hybrid sensor histidine kinase/response regulator n=1 Tax=Aliikangiella sp. G2MR2-5 TaxID=2788943 RepID=UPI0018AB5220|nr:PAS domain-containing protein [Aliikangiella sp. G2MR2-5]